MNYHRTLTKLQIMYFVSSVKSMVKPMGLMLLAKCKQHTILCLGGKNYMAKGMMKGSTRGHGNKQNNRRQSYQVKPSYSYGGCMIRDVRELDEAMNQRSRHQKPEAQTLLDSSMKTLLRHLEEGEVIYMTEMAIPSALTNKKNSVLITLRTTLRGEECTWVVRHEANESYIWEANYNCRESAFGAFRICSCDKVTPVR